MLPLFPIMLATTLLIIILQVRSIPGMIMVFLDQSDGVADTIVEAALGAWRMRRTPAGRASLLSRLRCFMPAGPVDTSLRKSLGLA
jgi:hypothetical protein